MKRTITPMLCTALFIGSACASPALELYVSPGGIEGNDGSKEHPLPFAAAVRRCGEQLRAEGPPAGGATIHVMQGRYRFAQPVVLGPEFSGTEERPIHIVNHAGGRVVFDGSMRIPAHAFQPPRSLADLKRISPKARGQILVATLSDPDLIARFNSKLMLNLSIDGTSYLPSVYPNEGYVQLRPETAEPESCPPGIPVGKQGYGIRAGNPPHMEPGRPQGWKGSLAEPRGAHARFDPSAPEMGGSWQQWEAELGRCNTRNQLTGFIEANWLLSSQAIVSADAAKESIHLSEALAYGWGWRKDKPCRIFGLLCEVDTPGEWHFDPATNQLFIYPPAPLTSDTDIALSVASGFIHLDGASHVSITGLSVQNVGSGTVYRIGGHHNLVAGCTVRDCTATGVEVAGTSNLVQSCDFVDLDRHVVLKGGVRAPDEITPGHNAVENCHIYQMKMRHEKVNIAMDGVGNRFARNLVHNSLGQAMVVNGNDQLVELNEFFNVGYDEGDGGAVYSGADMTGYGNTYRYNFFHHLMHVPGKVERSGIHLDDLQAGATCIGNIFFKSAGKGIHMNGGAGHTLRDNIFLEGYRGIYNTAGGGQKGYDRQVGIDSDPNHIYRNTKENYIGRAEKIVGTKGWENAPWKDRYPLMCEVLSDTGVHGRYWPIRCTVENNFYHGNAQGDHTIWSRASPEVMAKNIIADDRNIGPQAFVDYDHLDFTFRPGQEGLPEIPFGEIGLRLDAYRRTMPDKGHYRRTVREFFRGIPCMPGTTNRIDTAQVVEEGPGVAQ